MYSVTQGANVGQMIGLILMMFGSPVDSEAIDGFIMVCGAIISAFSVVISYINRFSKGDLTFGGFRK